MLSVDCGRRMKNYDGNSSKEETGKARHEMRSSIWLRPPPSRQENYGGPRENSLLDVLTRY